MQMRLIALPKSAFFAFSFRSRPAKRVLIGADHFTLQAMGMKICPYWYMA